MTQPNWPPQAQWPAGQYPAAAGYGAGYGPPPPPPPPPRRGGLPGWGWAIVVILGVILLGCLGGFGVLVYLASKGPETKVYVANEVPAKFVDAAREVGLIEPGEQVRLFYSDA